MPLVFAFWHQHFKKEKTMKNYLRNWNFMRVLRLALGIYIIVQGVIENQWMFVALGGLLSLMPLLNIGCCGASGCNTPVSKSNEKNEEVSYEEIR